MTLLDGAEPADQARGNTIRAQRRDQSVGLFLNVCEGLAVGGDPGHGCALGRG
jgi:hypothetical protein